MPYLIQNDLLKQIQQGNLNAITGTNYAIIDSWLLTAQETAEENLSQKYDISQEFTDTEAWNYSAVYQAANRVYLNAAAYDPVAGTYALNALTLQAGNIYQCSTAITVPEVFNAAHWTLLGAQYAFFYATYPKPVFNVYAFYNVGDMVFWNNNVYTAAKATQNPNDSYVLQYGSYGNIPLNNYFPDAPNQTQWTLTISGYNVPADTPISDTTYWTAGDNRSQKMVRTLINLVLYYAHFRISPQNIPVHIERAYNEALGWIKNAKGADISPKLTKLQPSKGARIRYGGDIRLNLRY
jgi:hypothetical protein